MIASHTVIPVIGVPILVYNDKQVKKTDKVFRIIGNIMVASSKTTVKKELSEKKELVDLRLKTMDKQEDKLRDKAAEIQKEVMKDIK